MAFGAWLGWSASALQHLSDGSQGFWLDTSQKSMVVALCDLGNVISPIPGGYLMDIVGRKTTLFFTSIIYIVASVCVLQAKNVWYLYAARVLIGLGKGIGYAVMPFYLAELASTEIRGALSTMFIGFLNLGMMYDYALGPVVTYEKLNLLNLLIAVMFLITFWLVPESPYYLVQSGKREKAKKALSKFRWLSENEPSEKAELDSELNEIIYTVERDMENKGCFVDLVTSSGNRKALLIITMLAIFQRLSGISPILSFSTLFMPDTGGGLPSNYYMILFSVILVLANYIASPLVDKFGRKPLLIISSVSSSIIMGAASVFYYMYINGVINDSFTWIPYLCLLLYGVSYSIGLGFLPSTMVVELFPAKMKCYAGSISAILLAATSFVVNNIFLIVEENTGVYAMFALFSLSCSLSTVFVVFFVFETKGKSFAEIQDILNGMSFNKQ